MRSAARARPSSRTCPWRTRTAVSTEAVAMAPTMRSGSGIVASSGSAAATAGPRSSRSGPAHRPGRARRRRRAVGRGQDDAAAGDGRRGAEPARQRLVDGQPTVASGRTPRVGWVPQLETVDWHFPATVREVVLMGRWSRRTWSPWTSRGRPAPPPTRCSNGSASAASATGRSASSRAASSSACSSPAPDRRPGAPASGRADERHRHQDARRDPPPARRPERARARRSS